MVMYALHYALRDVLIESQYLVGSYLIDAYIPSLNLAIEIDEKHHSYTIEDDLKRQKYIEEKIGCEFFRINVSKSLYSQVDELISKIKKLHPEKWEYILPNKNNMKSSGEFSGAKIKGLLESNSYEFIENLKNEVELLNFKTSTCTIPGHLPETNGYLGFMVNMDGIEFSVCISKSNKPKLLVTNFENDMPEKLGLELDSGNKDGEYYNILNFKGQKNTDEFLYFLKNLNSKM